MNYSNSICNYNSLAYDVLYYHLWQSIRLLIYDVLNIWIGSDT